MNNRYFLCEGGANLSFREILTDYYQIHTEEKVVVDGRNGFTSDGMFYFNTNSANFETIHLEQAVLAYYLLENGYRQIALPIQNKQEEWFTDYIGNRYLIYRVAERNLEKANPGKNLAEFHQIGSAYGFEPKEISSYGQWKRLWVDKLTLFEEKIMQPTSDEDFNDKQLLRDILPYIIGMSENAIQYLRETEEKETRYSEFDQGTIAFLRFNNELEQEVLWPDQFVYDHPVRDVVEQIRNIFLSGQSDKMLLEFLREYQTIRPLSIFSWRLVYARLLFPIHLFDAMEHSLVSDNSNGYRELQRLLNQQHEYEKRLRNFYEVVGIDKDVYGLEEVQWL